MKSALRLWTGIGNRLWPARRWSHNRRRPQSRARRLTLEACEPRCLLAAFPTLLTIPEAFPVGEPAPIEVISGGGEASWHVAPGELQTPHQRAGQEREAVPDEAQVKMDDQVDTTEDSEWNSLGAGPKTVALPGTLEESTGPLQHGSSSQPSLSGPQEDKQPQPSTPSEAAEQASPDGFSAVADRSAVGSALESERRQWTTATAVRYPLQGDGGWFPAGAAAGSSAVAASAQGFLDLARTAGPPATSLRLGSLSSPRAAFPFEDAAFAGFQSGVLSDLVEPGPTLRKSQPSVACGKQPTLTGESRGQRMMLLVATERRVGDREPARPRPAADGPAEAAPVPTRGVQRFHPHVSKAALVVPQPAGDQTADESPAVTVPLADSRTSRSTMEGLVVLVLLAAQVLRNARRPCRLQPQPVLLDPRLADSRRLAARDAFFGQLSRHGESPSAFGFVVDVFTPANTIGFERFHSLADLKPHWELD